MALKPGDAFELVLGANTYSLNNWTLSIEARQPVRCPAPSRRQSFTLTPKDTRLPYRLCCQVCSVIDSSAPTGTSFHTNTQKPTSE
jgi:hypothetical protein